MLHREIQPTPVEQYVSRFRDLGLLKNDKKDENPEPLVIEAKDDVFELANNSRSVIEKHGIKSFLKQSATKKSLMFTNMSFAQIDVNSSRPSSLRTSKIRPHQKEILENNLLSKIN